MRPTEVQGTGKQSGRKTGKRPLRPVEDYKDYTLHSLRIPRSAFDLREIRHLMHRRAHAGEEVEAGRALDLVRIIDGHLVEKRIHRSEEHTSELQSLMRISYAVFCLKKKNTKYNTQNTPTQTSQL